MKAIYIIFVLFISFGFFGCGESDSNSTPVAGDYIIGENLFQTVGSTASVSITARSGRSPGAVTVYYRGIQGTTYAKNTTNPAVEGNFLITFDVAAADGWNAAIDLVAGYLNINSGASGVILFEIPMTDIVDLIATAGRSQFLTMMRAANPALVGVPDEILVPQIPGIIISMLTDMNSMIGLVMPGVTYEALSLASDINYYHDAEGKQEFKGTDPINGETIIYSSIDFDLITLTVLGGPPRTNFTISALLTEIGFTGSISYPLTLNAFLGAVKSGMTYPILNDQGLSFFSAASGGTMNGNSNITGADMFIWSNWPLEAVASMF